MHPHLHIHIPIQTQAHTYSKYQNKTGIIVFLFIYNINLYKIYNSRHSERFWLDFSSYGYNLTLHSVYSFNR